MYSILTDMCVVEGACYVAAPSAGTMLAQLGADVIKFDPIGGGIDYKRYPLSGDGQSLFWPSINKGKRSIAVDVRTRQGRGLIRDIVVESGAGGGIFLTNFDLRNELSFESLSADRRDLIYARVSGDRNGRSQVDFTVNAQVGYPYLTGTGDGPVNNVVPAWDLLTGQIMTASILAADRQRLKTNLGQLVEVPLKQVALYGVSTLGVTTEYEINGEDRPAIGNYIYGGFGRDFITKDHKRIMIVGLSNKQWSAIGNATNLGPRLQKVGVDVGLDVDASEKDRFECRHAIADLLGNWISDRALARIAAKFNKAGVCWAQYRTTGEAFREDADLSEVNPMFTEIAYPGLGSFLSAGAPTEFSAFDREESVRSPVLGEHTDRVLEEVLGLSASAIGRLHDEKVVAGPKKGETK